MARPVDPAVAPEALSRRGVIRGAAVGGLGLPLLAACGGEDESAPAGGTDGSEPAAGGDPVTVPQADVPVGGGTVLTDAQVVVTQPTEGDFKAFTAVCTHQGCTVAAVAEGTINCDCHGSRFSIEDGAVVAGPAPAPLASKPVSAEGSDVVAG